MNKIIVSNKIVADAYNNAFANLERMDYVTAGKLIEFVEENHYPVEQDMVDYAKVIIFSNTNRVEEAVKLSERMLSRGLQTQELQIIVSDVHAQLLKQKEYSDRRRQKVDKISIDEVYHFLQVVKPSDSKLAEFISYFSNDGREENQFIEFYQNGQISEENGPLVAVIKILVAKTYFIEETYKTAKASEADGIKPLYNILNKSILSAYSNKDFLMFLYFHKSGLIKEMLIDERFDTRVRSFLAYQLDDLYTNKLIGRINVKMAIEGRVFEESIANLNQEFNQQVEKYGDELELIFNSGELHEDYYPLLLAQFQRLISYTYPVVNPMGTDPRKFIASFLYVISNNNYNSQFNAIIEDVYKHNQEELMLEMQMIDVLILI